MIAFKPAIREQAHIYIAIAGTPGSGKTLSAFKIARGLVGPEGKIGLIETEGQRSLDLYACGPNEPPGPEKFHFDRYGLQPPYSSARYKEAIEAGQTHVGPGGVLIVDTMTFEHAGQGGYLESHDKIAKAMAKDEDRTNDAVSFRAWGKVAPDRNALKYLFTAPKCHMILLFWAKEKNELQDRADGRKGKTVVNVGYRIVGAPDFLFQMTLAMLMTAETPGVPIIDRKVWAQAKTTDSLRTVVPSGKIITEQTGKNLAQWCAGRKPDEPGKREPTGEMFSVWVGDPTDGDDDRKHFADIESAARELWSQVAGAQNAGRIDLLVAWNAELLVRLPTEVREKLTPHIEKHREVFAKPAFVPSDAGGDDLGMAG